MELAANLSTGPKIPGVFTPYVDFVTSYPSEDINDHGLLDTEDTNANGRLDEGEDTNEDNLLTTEDTDGDGTLDPAGLSVHTGGLPVLSDFDKLMIRASMDSAVLDVAGLVQVTGSFAFEAGSSQQVTLADASTMDVAFATLAAAHAHAFVGVNGPYRQDVDLDGDIDVDDPVNADAIGIAIDDLNFAMSMMASVDPLNPATFFAMKASAVSGGLVGVPLLEATLQNLDFAVNVADGLLDGSPIDFTASFPDGELPIDVNGLPDAIALDFADTTLQANLDATLSVAGIGLNGTIEVTRPDVPGLPLGSLPPVRLALTTTLQSDFLSDIGVTGSLQIGGMGLIGSLGIVDTPFHVVFDTSRLVPLFGIDMNIDALRQTLLDVTGQIQQFSLPFDELPALTTQLPLIDQSLSDLLPGLSGVFDWYSAAIDYFQIVDAFRLDVTNVDIQAKIATWLGLPSFDPELPADLAQLQLQLDLIDELANALPDWDVQLYLPEIFAGITPDFDLEAAVPRIEKLLSLPDGVTLDDVRPQLPDSWGLTTPSLEGLFSFIQSAADIDSLLGALGEGLTFDLSPDFDMASGLLGINFALAGVLDQDISIELPEPLPTQNFDLGLDTATLTRSLDLDMGLTFDLSELPTLPTPANIGFILNKLDFGAVLDLSEIDTSLTIPGLALAW
ncbi:MAG: hypothetical protein R3C28_24845 [Pirellulaceae bacterium]